MILRRFVSILAEAGYILGLLARVEARPRTILQAALQVHTAAIPSLKRGGKGWLDDNRATMLGGDGIYLPRRLPEGPYQMWCIFFTKPHNIRSAKSTGSKGMASDSESLITGSRQPM
jgi:hypothetical protein